jgi:hypothetical protein
MEPERRRLLPSNFDASSREDAHASRLFLARIIPIRTVTIVPDKDYLGHPIMKKIDSVSEKD